ncbi:DUF1658 domain-containing protein [Coxiella burnetii]|nr:DUF1658 domain-containing protein [Coxiella burnetii]OYK91500.1 DUF1658 domain-containing protein [Coxiella burnetii]PNT79428.1 DUF1658 domain-containing protein [Coxiella burnetii]PNT80622.1 DUF1658 domain-containing protein [Coxiella burnetii]PNT83754.1 DUF1658 domain-containing protein [Coxiella burnetii]
MKKLKIPRPPARPSAVVLKHTKPSRPSREDRGLRKAPMSLFLAF